MLGSSRTVREGTPCSVLVLIEDLYLTILRSSRNGDPRQQADAARAAVHLSSACSIGCFMSVQKCIRKKFIFKNELGRVSQTLMLGGRGDMLLFSH